GSSQAHGQGLDGVEPGLQRLGREPGPSPVGRGEILAQDRLARAVAVETGAFLGLQLEQLEHPHGLAGRGHDAQVAFGSGQHEPGGSDVEYLDTAIRQQREQLYDVEVVDEVVGELHQCASEHGFSWHAILPFTSHCGRKSCSPLWSSKRRARATTCSATSTSGWSLPKA